MVMMLLNSFATETILRYPSVVTIGIFAIAGLVGWGVYKNIIARLKDDVAQHTKDIVSLKIWGETELAKAVKQRADGYVTKEMFIEVVRELRSKLEDVNIIELNSRLARIETMVEQLLENRTL